MAKKRGGVAAVAEPPVMNVINKRFDPECPVSALKLHPDNPRQGDVGALHTSIDTNGFYGAVVAQESTGYVLAGNHRKIAAEQIGALTLPTIWVDCDDATAKRILTADNRLNDLADYDTNALAKLLEEIREDETGLGWMGTGWDDEAFANLLDDLNGIESEEAAAGLTEDDDVPNVPPEATTVLGDLWILGKHRLLCGDSTSIDAVQRLAVGCIDMLFTDPPYGVKERTSRKSNGRGMLAECNDFDPVLGDDSTDTAVDAYRLCAGLQIPLMVVWGANYFASDLPNTSSWIVWDKREGKGRNDNADCELAWTNRSGPARVFAHLWNGMIKASERGERRVHPTQKPVALAEWCIAEYPKSRVDTVLDLFGGSGSTLIACEKTKRKARLMELDPKYCDVIVKRWQDYTGKIAKLESDGRTFNDIANLRKPKTGTAAAP